MGVATKTDPEIELALRSVAEGPLDEGRKRVFTDLLLERGDPRGEFMLLQFVIAANQASGAVRQRANELWQRHKREWTKELAGVVTDLELENGFPVAGTVGATADPAKVLGSAMFATLERIRAGAGGEALLLAAAADPRLTALDTLEVNDAQTLQAICERGVPGRLRKLILRAKLGARERALLLAAPALSQLRWLVFLPTIDPPRRRGFATRVTERLSGLFTGKKGAPSPLIELDTHPTLEVLELPGGQGNLELFAQVAPLWPKLGFRRISAAGTFELEREEHGTLIVLQNFTVAQLVQLRALVPPDVTRARLSRQRQWGAEPLEPLFEAWAPIAVTMV